MFYDSLRESKTSQDWSDVKPYVLQTYKYMLQNDNFLNMFSILEL